MAMIWDGALTLERTRIIHPVFCGTIVFNNVDMELITLNGSNAPMSYRPS